MGYLPTPVLLTITTTHTPATDLGFLLHKNPSRVHGVDVGHGKASLFYPEAHEHRCTAALLVEIDPIGLVRGGPSEAYVNDRPYVASSHLSVAMGNAFGTAMTGRSKERPELADRELPFEVRMPVVRVRGGEALLKQIFEPLGYEVIAKDLPLDEQFPEWGPSRYVDLTLRTTKKLKEMLGHLYVLIPALDEQKHYFVNRDELEKLLRRGEGWLKDHPAKGEIVRRYLRRDKSLVSRALAQLQGDEAVQEELDKPDEDAAEPAVPLHTQRLQAVVDEIRASGARTVLDLGCGEGKLLRMLLKEKTIAKILAMDVSYAVLERTKDRIVDRLPRLQAQRVELIHGSLVYRDRRLAGFDAAAIVEVIEHLDEGRLAAFQRVVFEFARPSVVVLTTPNREYNALFEGLTGLRHKDHRFEWTRAEFQAWCEGVCAAHAYTVQITPIGPSDEQHGAPSQMAVFRRSG